jgi:hypothetical protein
MMQLCPLCNGLYEQEVYCPSCTAKLQDGGMLENYYEPYSPYLPGEILDQADGVLSQEKCIHLFYCPNCGYDHRFICELISCPHFT